MRYGLLILALTAAVGLYRFTELTGSAASKVEVLREPASPIEPVSSAQTAVIEVEAPSQDADEAIAEIAGTLNRLPRDEGPAEKLRLLQLAHQLPTTEKSSEKVAQLALDLAAGELHAAKAGERLDSFEKYNLPVGAFEIFIERTQDPRQLVESSERVLRAQTDAAARRLLYRYFAVVHPELAGKIHSSLLQDE